MFAVPGSLIAMTLKSLRLMRHEFLLVGKGMAEVATMTIGAGFPIKDHKAHLSLVTGVAKDWTEFLNAMSKLTVTSIWACSSLLPFVTKLSFSHSLIVHL